MNILINILKLDKDQIRFLLQNHKFFEPDEIKLAAKMKVKNDKAADYELFVERLAGEGQKASYEAQIRGLAAYDLGYSQSQLVNFLGFDGFGSRF